jgi:hypothetical protein
MKKISQIVPFLALVALGLGCAAEDATPQVTDVASSSAEIINRDPGGGGYCWWDTDSGLCCFYPDGWPSHPWSCTWCTSNPTCT